MLDHYVYGRAERISPEAPVPVLDWEREEWRLGGAANVALNLRTLGARPLLVGLTGDDEHAQRLCDMLAEQDIEPEFLAPDPTRPTTVKTRLYSKNQQLLRLDRESVADHSLALHGILAERLAAALDGHPVTAVVLQDYNKGTLTEALIQTVLEMARQRSIPVVVDPKKNNYFAYREVAVFKPNLKEVSLGFGREVRPELEELKKVDEHLRARLSHQQTVITLGEHGLFWSDERGHAEIVPADRLSVVDVCGAGDSVVSVLAAGLAVGMPFGEVVRTANKAGGVACSRHGVAPVGWQDLSL